MIHSFEVSRNGNKIRGFINRPDKEGKYPCLIYSHGFTGHMSDSHFMLAKLSKTLENLNIVSIRFDFLGTGESDGNFKDMTLSNEVADCETVINYAKTLNYIDANNINLIGFSMGGAVATITASKNINLINRAILISPAANIANIFMGGIRNEKIHVLLKEGIIDFNGNVLGKDAIDDALNINIYDKAKELNKLKGNILLIHGSNDETVPPFISLKFKEILGEKATLKIIYGADHCYSSREYEKEILETIKSFLNT